MATGPKLPETPLELLNDDRVREIPLLSRFWAPVTAGLVGFAAVCVVNYCTKRPAMSGIQKHIIVTGLSVVVGKYAEDYRNEFLAEKDAVMRHYITLHPEDFPPYDRKRFAEVLEPWYPIR